MADRMRGIGANFSVKALLCGFLALGCAAPSSTPVRGPGGPALNADRQTPAYSLPGVTNAAAPEHAWTTSAEEAGVITDGVAIVRAAVEVTDGVQRFVIDFDGSGAPPHAKLENGDAPNTLWLTMNGVRGVPADLPLLTGEDGRKINEPAPTQSSPIVSYGRVFLPDDSAIRVELTLDSMKPHRLLASEKPRRLTLELQR